MNFKAKSGLFFSSRIRYNITEKEEINMKTIMKAGITAVAAVFSLCALGACGEETPPPAKEDPGVVYAVDESIVGQYNANAPEFYVDRVEKTESPLDGKVIYWLGSSVTYGASSGGESMADFLAAKTGCISKKNAVSGTTIFDDNKSDNTGSKSYTRRLTNSTVFLKDEAVDAFICQISTNDAWGDRRVNWGEISGDDVLDEADFDRATTLGGIEYIIAYVSRVWHCPVYFYSGAYFGDKGVDPAPRANENPKGSDYGALVDKVYEIAHKWQVAGYDVQVIDLFYDEAFNAAVSDDYYSWATSDPIHPKRVGYLQWWTPYFEHFLTQKLCK